MTDTVQPGLPGTFPLAPLDRWERFILDGVHCGFLHRRLEDGVLTTRTAFEPGADLQGANPHLPARFMAQCRIGFAPDGATWEWADYEDSDARQRVRIERERAGIAPETVPSYADALLVPAVARTGAALAYARLEESSPLQGGLRAPRVRLSPTPITVSVQSPAESAPTTAWRLELALDAQVIGVHVVADGALVASEWGAGASSLPVPDDDQALEGLSEDLVTFARLPRE